MGFFFSLILKKIIKGPNCIEDLKKAKHMFAQEKIFPSVPEMSLKFILRVYICKQMHLQVLKLTIF